MTFKMNLINNIFPQQRKNPFNSSQLPDDHLSQHTKNEQWFPKNGRTGFFQTSKEGKYYFYGLDIFICLIYGLREILRVLLPKITFKRKWKVLRVLSIYCAHCSPAWGKEAEILETGSSRIPVLELTLVVWPLCLGFPGNELGNVFGQTHAVTHLRAFIGCLPRADTILGLKLKDFVSRQKGHFTVLWAPSLLILFILTFWQNHIYFGYWNFLFKKLSSFSWFPYVNF